MSWREAEREYTDEVVDRTTLGRMFEDAAKRHENRPAQRYKGGIYDRSLVDAVLSAPPDGEFRAISYETMRTVVRRLAAGFQALGVEAGDRVGLFANTRIEWAQVDFGVLAIGGVVTTVYAGSSERRVRYLLDDAGATVVVVENADTLDRVLAVEEDLSLSAVVSMDRLDGHPATDRTDVYTLGEVYALGEERFDRETYQSWLDGCNVDDLASIIYTSGTTGTPKGVGLTHGNFRANVNQVRKRFGPRPDKGDVPVIDETTSTVSYLPLAHVFERTSGHFLVFASGGSVAYAESPDTLREDFSLVKPTTATSVPRVYEKMYDAIREEASDSSVRRRVFEWATDVGRRYTATEEPGLALRVKRGIADRVVFRQVREALGGNVEMFISGGGSLAPELAELYYAMGLPLFEGYGLTETAPVLTVNPVERPQTGTIGPPVVGVDYRIDGSVTPELGTTDGETVGELLVAGPNVFEGYWGDSDATAEAFTDDGYFRTGDVVEERPDGYITFRERSKQLLVLSTGKNVAPGPIEDAVALDPAVDACMLVGNDEKFVAALVVPDFERIGSWAASEGVEVDYDDARESTVVRDRVEAAIEAVNKDIESHETVEKFRLVDREWTEENGFLTPTLKKKRRRILDEHAALVEEIYDEVETTAVGRSE
jgi:long-chain acyl-CoA synthetase